MENTDHHLLVGSGRTGVRAEHGVRHRGRPQHRAVAQAVARMEAPGGPRTLPRSHQAVGGGLRGRPPDGARRPHRLRPLLGHDQLRRHQPEGRDLRRDHDERPRVEDSRAASATRRFSARASTSTATSARRVRPGAERPTSTISARSSSSSNMRRGLAPKDAGMEALKRIRANTVEKRLLAPTGEPHFQIIFYIAQREGRVRRRLDVPVEVRRVHRAGAAVARLRAALPQPPCAGLANAPREELTDAIQGDRVHGPPVPAHRRRAEQRVVDRLFRGLERGLEERGDAVGRAGWCAAPAPDPRCGSAGPASVENAMA